MWEYICPKCRKTVKKSSHECPHCGERFPLALRVPPSFLKNPKKLEEYVHKHIFPRVSAFERAYLTQFFTTIFETGFETADCATHDFCEWTGTVEDTGSATVNTDNPEQGSYNAEFTATGGSNFVVVYEEIGPSYTHAFLRGYVKYASMPSGTSFVMPCVGFWVGSSSTNTARGGIGRDGSGNAKWAIRYYDDGSFYNTFGSNTPQAGIYYCVELEVLIDSSNGLVKLYVNGSLEVSVTEINNAARQFQYAHFGIDATSGSGTTSTLYGDCVVVADEGPIGPEEEGPTLVEVADSLELAETILRNKTLILSDSLGLADFLYGNKSLLLSDSASLSELVTVIIGEVMKYVTDSVSSADLVSTPSRVLRALEAIGAADNVAVNKVLQITEVVALAEIVEVGVGGVKKTRLFLILGDLAVQLTGD